VLPLLFEKSIGDSAFSTTALTYFVNSARFSVERVWYKTFVLRMVWSCARSSCSSNSSEDDDAVVVDNLGLLILELLVLPKPDPECKRVVSHDVLREGGAICCRSGRFASKFCG